MNPVSCNCGLSFDCQFISCGNLVEEECIGSLVQNSTSRLSLLNPKNNNVDNCC